MARLVQSFRTSLQDELGGHTVDMFYWVDSYSALCWIRNDKHWSQYVRHHVDQILQTSFQEQWFHCPGIQNPADLPSRGKYTNIADNLFRWEGPTFLKSDREEWPKIPCSDRLETENAMKEKTKTEPDITYAILARDRMPGTVMNIVDIERFNSKGTLLRTLAWVIRFIDNAKAVINKKSVNKEEIVSTDEVSAAEIKVIRAIQSQHFESEIEFLTSNETIRKTRKKNPLVC